MSWDPFLMKKLLKKEVYEFREQYMGPTIVTQQPQNAQKKKHVEADAFLFIRIQTQL